MSTNLPCAHWNGKAVSESCFISLQHWVIESESLNMIAPKDVVHLWIWRKLNRSTYLDMPWNLPGRVNFLGTSVQPSTRNIHQGLLGHCLPEKANPKENLKAALHSGFDWGILWRNPAAHLLVKATTNQVNKNRRKRQQDAEDVLYLPQLQEWHWHKAANSRYCFQNRKHRRSQI